MDTRKVADLRIHPRADVVPFPDPETHEQMAADVERRGIVTPLDILDDGLVLDGRTRLSIARVLGITEVPVRVVSPADPFDYMVRAALMRRDLKPSQRAVLALELPEYQKAKADAAERRTENLRAAQTDTNVRLDATPTRASDAIAETVGVSGSYIRKAEFVAKNAPELVEEIKAGRMTVGAAATQVREAQQEEPTPIVNKEEATEHTRRLPVIKRTRPLRPWARHFTTWCRAALPEDKPVLLEMAREIDQALSRIGATR